MGEAPENPALAKAILKKGNDVCVDCGVKAPGWASGNLGILMCIDCAGIHRHLGVHISKVRSLTLDKWTPDCTKFVASIGNSLSNEFYLHGLPASYTRPTHHDSKATLSNWIRNKYERKLWAPPSRPEPWELVKRGADPRSALPRSLDKETDNGKFRRRKGKSKVEGEHSSRHKAEKSDKATRGSNAKESGRSLSVSRSTSPKPQRRIQQEKEAVNLIDFDNNNAASSSPTPAGGGFLSSPVPPMPTSSLLLTEGLFGDAGPHQQHYFASGNNFTPRPPTPSTMEAPRAFGIEMTPPTAEKLQEAKIAAARESIARLYSQPNSMGLGVPSFPPPIIPLGFGSRSSSGFPAPINNTSQPTLSIPPGPSTSSPSVEPSASSSSYLPSTNFLSGLQHFTAIQSILTEGTQAANSGKPAILPAQSSGRSKVVANDALADLNPLRGAAQKDDLPGLLGGAMGGDESSSSHDVVKETPTQFPFTTSSSTYSRGGGDWTPFVSTHASSNSSSNLVSSTNFASNVSQSLLSYPPLHVGSESATTATTRTTTPTTTATGVIKEGQIPLNNHQNHLQFDAFST